VWGRFRSCLYKWGMASSADCECGAKEQTVDLVVLQCPIHRPPHGLHELTVLDDETNRMAAHHLPGDLVRPSSGLKNWLKRWRRRVYHVTTAHSQARPSKPYPLSSSTTDNKVLTADESCAQKRAGADDDDNWIFAAIKHATNVVSIQNLTIYSRLFIWFDPCDFWKWIFFRQFGLCLKFLRASQSLKHCKHY